VSWSVESGLCVEVDGYDAFIHDSSGRVLASPIALDRVDRVVAEFCRNAATLDVKKLPASVISPADDQPIHIRALAHHPEAVRETMVAATWRPAGLAPDITRLVKKIRKERKQLPEERPGVILIDLKLWDDFQYADYYLREVAERLKRHKMPALIGTFIAPLGEADPLERTVLHVDPAWLKTEGGRRFHADWKRD
jgi:hypothetical protein